MPRNRSNFSIIFHEPSTSARSCGAAEFGIGCLLAAPFAGREYYLPGDGPGGFTCTCS